MTVRLLLLAGWTSLLAPVAQAMVASPGSTLAADSASSTVSGDAGMIGEGWMVNGGYFFKDKMFGNGARGGIHIDGGRAFALSHWVALWAGAGALEASAAQRFVSAAGPEYRSTWTVRSVYADVGVVIPWMPFPIALAIYRASSEVSDAAQNGPYAGRTLAADRDAFGMAIDIHILFEWFLHAERTGHRGLGFVLGYVGFIDLSGKDLAVTDALGGTVTHVNWRPMKGESLRGGIEYEF